MGNRRGKAWWIEDEFMIRSISLSHFVDFPFQQIGSNEKPDCNIKYKMRLIFESRLQGEPANHLECHLEC